MGARVYAFALACVCMCMLACVRAFVFLCFVRMPACTHTLFSKYLLSRLNESHSQVYPFDGYEVESMSNVLNCCK